jgi:23S rRNA pseudouridine1911/1915/1917 synthase
LVHIDIKGSPEDPDQTLVTIEVPPGQMPDIRIDVYLTERLANVTRTKVQQGIKAGRVKVNSAPVRSSYIVQPGDVIECVILRPPPMEAQPEAIELDIVFEDDELIVVDKPAGMVVHPAYGNRSGTLVNALLHHTGSRLSLLGEGTQSDPEASAVRPGLVHRLDKDTSGLMVVAKTDAAHSKLAHQFQERSIKRLYEAVVWGKVPEAGRIETRLGRDPKDRKRMAVVASPAGKPAITLYEPIEPLTGTTLVQFRLLTGRTHQIRVHSAHQGHPIFGDETYGGRKIRLPGLSKSRRRFFQNNLERMPRQALHARTLGFVHPSTNESVFFESEPPEDMKVLLDSLRRGFG